MMNRRHFFAAGAVVAAGAIAVPVGIVSASAGADTITDKDLQHGYEPNTGTRPLAVQPAGTTFTGAMPIPPVLAPAQTVPNTDSYQIEVTPATVSLVPGMSSSALTFGGTFIGPTINATVGRPVQITYTNHITDPVAVHLHGGHTAPDSDGYPMDLIQPGKSRTYTYSNSQQGCTMWYHDHAMGMESSHVYHGLHGMYVLRDPSEASLNLPTGNQDVPIMIRDVQLDTGGNMVYDVQGAASRNTILINGVATPFFQVATRKYRFRLINSANERILTLALSDGSAFHQIASDGGLLDAPVRHVGLTLGSAERADIVIDFSKYRLGTQVFLTDTSGQILRFDVVRSETDTSQLPTTLRALPTLPTPTVSRNISMAFDFSSGMAVGTINGAAFDPNVIDFTVKRGATEEWTITNNDTAPGIDHSFHMHLVQFQVISRTGSPHLPDDAGLKDTVRVPPGTSVKVRAKFTDYLGKYVFHCHYLEHSSAGMMGQFQVVS